MTDFSAKVLVLTTVAICTWTVVEHLVQVCRLLRLCRGPRKDAEHQRALAIALAFCAVVHLAGLVLVIWYPAYLTLALIYLTSAITLRRVNRRSTDASIALQAHERRVGATTNAQKLKQACEQLEMLARR